MAASPAYHPPAPPSPGEQPGGHAQQARCRAMGTADRKAPATDHPGESPLVDLGDPRVRLPEPHQRRPPTHRLIRRWLVTGPTAHAGTRWQPHPASVPFNLAFLEPPGQAVLLRLLAMLCASELNGIAGRREGRKSSLTCRPVIGRSKTSMPGTARYRSSRLCVSNRQAARTAVRQRTDGAMGNEQPALHEAAFRPRARLVSILGEHLISDQAVGLIELVKNAYDQTRPKWRSRFSTLVILRERPLRSVTTAAE